MNETCSNIRSRQAGLTFKTEIANLKLQSFCKICFGNLRISRTKEAGAALNRSSSQTKQLTRTLVLNTDASLRIENGAFFTII